jgi:hypothetical protein
VRRLRLCGRFRVGYRHGRAALVLSSDRRYHLHGLRPGGRPRGGFRQLRIGRDRWYLTGRGVARVRAGRVREVGVARKGVGRALLRRFS